MNAFSPVFCLEEIIKAAKQHYINLESCLLGAQYQGRMVPMVLIDYEHFLNIPAYGSIPEIKTNLVHYHQKFLTTFLYGKECCGEEGKGMYGIGMYSQTADGRWACDSILFDGTSHGPLLIKGRKAALEIATAEARSRDKSGARANESAITEHGLIETSTMNAILGALSRSESKSIPIMIGIRAGKIKLLLEGDDEDGQCLHTPEAGFACRDAAAGIVLQAIAYATNAAWRTRRELESDAA